MDFKKQIDEDLSDYSSKNKSIPHIDEPAWAFNYWVLDKLYSIDSEIVQDYITDYHDEGIDCFVWHEDTLDLYLIQNKYYSENNEIKTDMIMKGFITRALGAIEHGQYTRSAELQRIYNVHSENPEFTIHFNVYITNNQINKNLDQTLKSFNAEHAPNIVATIYYLDDIEKQYFGSPITGKKSFDFKIETVKKGTVLQVNTKDYGLSLPIDAKYALTPVVCLYRMYKKAKESNYSLFDDNIREYLGSRVDVNKGMKNTLSDPADRQNFFYYNNGVTIIVKKMGPVQTSDQTIKILNPQIVNGCQTVSTIFETLNALPESQFDDFKNTYVMLKILEIPDSVPESHCLMKNIVKYNNSQNAIKPKYFNSEKTKEYNRIQREFFNRGILLCIKQSDRVKFKEDYKIPSRLIENLGENQLKFGLNLSNKVDDYLLDLDKLLQIILAFDNSQSAVQNKSKVLKDNSEENNKVTTFIKDTTINNQFDLYLFYLRVEQERKANASKFNSFMMVNCFGKYLCSNNPELISESLISDTEINRIIDFYSKVLNGYSVKWERINVGKAYNDMIKSPIDWKLIEETKSEIKVYFTNYNDL